MANKDPDKDRYTEKFEERLPHHIKVRIAETRAEWKRIERYMRVVHPRIMEDIYQLVAKANSNARKFNDDKAGRRRPDSDKLRERAKRLRAARKSKSGYDKLQKDLATLPKDKVESYHL
jgi:hypothetical protein